MTRADITIRGVTKVFNRAGGGNVHALGQGFSMMQELGLIQRLPRICLAQAERANPLYRAFQDGFGPAWDAVTTPAAKHGAP